MDKLKEVKKGEIIAEGKTKRVSECIGDELPHIYLFAVDIQFKSDITAGDGEKCDIIVGKAEIDCQTNDNFFRLLNKMGISTHYMGKLNDTEFLARRLKYKFPLEVVTRRVAYGSILDRTNFAKGHHFKDLYTEFFYKDDSLHDPRLDDQFIKVKDKAGYFGIMRNINEAAFVRVEDVLRKLGYQLIDWKLEYGIVPSIENALQKYCYHDRKLKYDPADSIIIIDEITAGNIRVWPIKAKSLDLSADNLLDQLDPAGMLDKELFRQGKDLGTVKSSFEALMELTNQFHKFY